MRLFRLAIEEQRWDLAAHTIVFAAARLLNEVARPDIRRAGEKKNATKVGTRRNAAKRQAEIQESLQQGS